MRRVSVTAPLFSYNDCVRRADGMRFTVEEVEVHGLLIGGEVHEQPAAAPCLQWRGTTLRLKHLGPDRKYHTLN